MRMTLSAFLVSALLGLGCGKSQPSSDVAHSVIPKEVEEVYKMRCTPCHGERGAGDGMAAASLQPKPRNFRVKSWHDGITDEEIEKIIVGGGPAIGKAPSMPPNPDLGNKPEVVAGLRAKVRSFGGR